MIESFKDKKLQRFWLENNTRAIPTGIARALHRKLSMIAFAEDINDLRVPPANHFEALKGDLAGYYSIRVNRQWRIVFRWRGNAAYEISLMDYH